MVPLCNMEYEPDCGGWISQLGDHHACQQNFLCVSRHTGTCSSHGQSTVPATSRRKVHSTGAQINIVDAETIRAMGLDTDALITSTSVIKGAAARSHMDILGLVFLQSGYTWTATCKGKGTKTIPHCSKHKEHIPVAPVPDRPGGNSTRLPQSRGSVGHQQGGKCGITE